VEEDEDMMKLRVGQGLFSSVEDARGEGEMD
jgi:hypothetical protein